MLRRLAGFLLLCAAFAHAANIKGAVSDAVGGEPLGRVQVVVVENGTETVTSEDGTFQLRNLNPGKYTIRLNAVRYRTVTVALTLSSAEENKELEVTLAPDNFQRTDKVEVHGDVFQGVDSPAINETNLTSSEIKEASTVFADDPFRALQSLPGVSASGNNELLAQFSVMGAPFANVGVYLDDVLTQNPFHSVADFANGASLSLLTSETTEEMKLLPVAYPEKYGDAIGAALDIHTREGSRTSPAFRTSAGLADSDFLGEGQLGRSKRGSWLASARNSYLGYLLHSLGRSDFADVSFYDADLKLTYDLTPNQTVNAHLLGGHTDAKNRGAVVGVNDTKTGASDFYFYRAGWRWNVSHDLLLDSRAAYIRHPFIDSNNAGQELYNDSYSEWVGGSSAVWNWRKSHVLEGGVTLRRLQDRFTYFGYTAPGQPPNSSTRMMEADLRALGYTQQASTLFHGRLHVLGGLRWDDQQRLDSRPFLPQVSAAYQVGPSTQLQFGVGRYNQFLFPDTFRPDPICSILTESLQRATHYTAAVEQRLGDATRIRLSGFDRQTENFESVQHSPGCPATTSQATFSIGTGSSRGMQLVLQRRSANRLSGWIGYTLVFAQQVNSAVINGKNYAQYLPALEDQRHSLNAFASYRLTPSINLSGKLLYGSGYPVSVFANVLGQPPFVQRLPAYARLDFRVDKSWALTRWKTTLYGEVLNVTNHNNVFATGFQAGSPQPVMATERALPLVPTAGLVFEF
jgi:hypothetical protein